MIDDRADVCGHEHHLVAGDVDEDLEGPDDVERGEARDTGQELSACHLMMGAVADGGNDNILMIHAIATCVTIDVWLRARL